MSPPWRDERIGLLKSAVQKAIRRGETDLAYAAAERLLALPGGRSALARRLPVIAAEDVGWWWIPAASVDGEGPNAEAELLRTTTGLSSVPKQKEAYHLADTVWEERLPVSVVSADAFRDALLTSDHRTALAIALAARERRQWRSGERLIRVLAEAFADAPDVSRMAAESALRREAKGGSGTDELLAAAIIAAIDRPDGAPATLPTVNPAVASVLRLPWWVADSHVAVGERVLRRVAMRRGMSYRMLAELQFSYESVLLGPAEIPSRWRVQAIAMDAVAYGWGTDERGMDLWRTLRPEVSSALERELSRLQL